MEESITWFRETVPELDESDVDTLARMYRTLSKADAEHGDARLQRGIGPRALVELKIVALTYAELFRGDPAHHALLAESVLVRDARATSRADLRATRMVPTVRVRGETLVLRVQTLAVALERALLECGGDV